MKIVQSFIVAVLLLFNPSGKAQGFIEYTTHANGALALPPNASPVTARSFLALWPDGDFGGQTLVGRLSGITSVKMYHSIDQNQLGTEMFELTYNGIAFGGDGVPPASS